MMKSIQVSMASLLEMVQEIAGDNMATVTLTINDEETDQGGLYPSFLHFEAYSEDGTAKDYESIDSISMVISVKPIALLHGSVKDAGGRAK